MERGEESQSGSDYHELREAAGDAGTEKSSKFVRLEAVGQKFINGVSSKYDDDYPPELQDKLPQRDFEHAMMRINDRLATNWPCTTLYFCGYACMPCTLGLSLCCPNVCISEAEAEVNNEIEQMNLTDIYRRKGVSFRLRKSCFHSWIEIHYPA